MVSQFTKAVCIWGFVLWLIGYVFGIVLFPLVPHAMIGWVIMPIGVLVTLWVLLEKIKAESLKQYLFVAVTWTLLAIVLDYFLLVRIFKPTDGYYKLDVYLYYLLTCILPILTWSMKTKSRSSRN